MKYRYGYNKKGRIVQVAKVYSFKEHAINAQKIDYHAIGIIKVLTKKGFQAYIVGGAIRDILLGKTPKDFDIATNAHPNKIKSLFPYARIVGKRFRIVLLPIGKGRFIEVSTFRSDIDNQSQYNPQTFGTIDTDVKRRDFTCNALYYDPLTGELIDYVNAFNHLKQRRLVPIRLHFEEDPVRILRAIKFSMQCELHLNFKFLLHLRKNIHLIAQVSRSRMTEEVLKILVGGSSAHIFYKIYKEKLLLYIMPGVYEWLKTKKRYPIRSSDNNVKKRFDLFLESLARHDLKKPQFRDRTSAIHALIEVFVKEYIQTQKRTNNKISSTNIINEVKNWIRPITPPNLDIKNAVQLLIDNKRPKSKPPKKRQKKN